MKRQTNNKRMFSDMYVKFLESVQVNKLKREMHAATIVLCILNNLITFQFWERKTIEHTLEFTPFIKIILLNLRLILFPGVILMHLHYFIIKGRFGR